MARILIIDDDPFVRNALSRVLKEHDLTQAAGGQEGLECLAKDASFALILCDLMMPEVSGIDIYEYLRQNHPLCAQTLVFLTGGVFTDEAQDFLARIDNQVVEKPFDFPVLRRVIDEHLGRSE